jgi:hypothetical protein
MNANAFVTVGVPVRNEAGLIADLLRGLLSHPLCVGKALHRYPEFKAYVEGAQFPEIGRWVFGRICMWERSFDSGAWDSQAKMAAISR